MSKTLLVWEEIPEDRRFYLIPNEIVSKYQEFFDAAHNKYINCDEDNEGMRFLNNALSAEKTDAEEGWDDGDFNQYRGVLREYQVPTEQPVRGEVITDVYLSGFAL